MAAVSINCETTGANAVTNAPYRLDSPHHVTGGIGGYELPTYLVQWGAVVISNRYNVALRMPHTRYFFMDDDGLAITDQRTQSPQPVTIEAQAVLSDK